ncbi:feline leukemia virus subgroup C receptor-related protein 2-like protein [Dinothrombium tinctorium]|uniref:Feline leukemia virus subgroup C receptor-related protein 2-like protein n=1 Tax=Dinothrombium tinctorium TaxID=1965070 RepID=A0A3S3ND16_9ACAR|nr:feline leukemia virus subgroup C receptor-related protein 2-like protein [Dinothrombium tinctorium]RWS00397.1 feline leukemia virus subgroup C receptor-related protein 2-like protein [Dinothrombium tinctorium]RWS01307.1 feline leukemia virus subgroup C receptor-related protein 2-like protein [Dinothrombium tinctorium]
MSIETSNKRYLILLLMAFATLLNVVQHLEFSSISNVVTYYYKVSPVMVTLTSLVFSISSVLLIYPVAVIVEKFGARPALVFGSFFSAFAANFKCFTVKSDLFGLLLLGQVFAAIGYTLAAPTTPRLVAAWFKSDETAMVMGILNVSALLASIICFWLPTLLFENLEDKLVVESKLAQMSLILAVASTIMFVAMVIFLKEEPLKPPTLAEKARKLNRSTSNTCEPLSKLLENKNYILLGISLLMNFKLGIVFTVLLNQLIMSMFDTGVHLVTACGTFYNIAGFFGALILPFLIDKYKKFKSILITCYTFLIAFAALLFACVWYKNVILLLLTMFGIGLFHCGYTVIATDTLIEITYPYPESKAIGLLFNVSSIFTCILTPMMSSIIATFGVIYVHTVICCLLMIGFICLCFVKWDLKRVRANSEISPLILTEE